MILRIRLIRGKKLPLAGQFITLPALLYISKIITRVYIGQVYDQQVMSRLTSVEAESGNCKLKS